MTHAEKIIKISNYGIVTQNIFNSYVKKYYLTANEIKEIMYDFEYKHSILNLNCPATPKQKINKSKEGDIEEVSLYGYDCYEYSDCDTIYNDEEHEDYFGC